MGRGRAGRRDAGDGNRFLAPLLGYALFDHDRVESFEAREQPMHRAAGEFLRQCLNAQPSPVAIKLTENLFCQIIAQGGFGAHEDDALAALPP